MLRTVFVMFSFILIAGCGKKEPAFSSPRDGQVFTTPSFSPFLVTLADNDYSETTIEIRGLESLQGRVQCSTTLNGPASCSDISFSRTSIPTSTVTQSCTQTSPCYHYLWITATRGDTSKTISVRIDDIGLSGQIGTR